MHERADAAAGHRLEESHSSRADASRCEAGWQGGVLACFSASICSGDERSHCVGCYVNIVKSEYANAHTHKHTQRYKRELTQIVIGRDLQ